MNNTTTAKPPCKLIFADFKNKVKVGERYVTQTPWMCNVCGHSYLYTPEVDRKPGQKVMKYLPLTVNIPVANKMNKVEMKDTVINVCEKCADQVHLAFQE